MLYNHFFCNVIGKMNMIWKIIGYRLKKQKQHKCYTIAVFPFHRENENDDGFVWYSTSILGSWNSDSLCLNMMRNRWVWGYTIFRQTHMNYRPMGFWGFFHMLRENEPYDCHTKGNLCNFRDFHNCNLKMRMNHWYIGYFTTGNMNMVYGENEHP